MNTLYSLSRHKHHATIIMKSCHGEKHQIASYSIYMHLPYLPRYFTTQSSNLMTDESDPSMLSSMLSSKRILQKTGTDNPSDKPAGICEFKMFQKKKKTLNRLGKCSPGILWFHDKNKNPIVSNPWGLMISKNKLTLLSPVVLSQGKWTIRNTTTNRHLE